jgi:fucokinase
MQQTPIDLSLVPKRLQNVPQSTNICTLSVFGVDDGIKHRVDMPFAQFCGRPWSSFLSSSVSLDDVWPGLVPNQRTLWRAALYPLIDLDAEVAPQLAAATWWLSAQPSAADVSAWLASPRLSLYDIFHCSDSAAAAAWRCDTLAYKIDLKRCARQLISRGSQPVLYRSAAAFADSCARGNEQSNVYNSLEEWCSCLERIALESIDSNADDITARSLSLVGAALHAACGPVHSHSSASGVYDESAWTNALNALSTAVALNSSVNSALQSLFSIRSTLLRQLHSVDADAISAILSDVSRFYDSASQLFIRRRVERDVSIEQVSFSSTAALSAHGSWARVTACARVDLAGGWSDTPPIAYEVILSWNSEFF